MSELSDFELMAYLEGEAPREVSNHLEQCASCSQRLKVLAGEQALLKSRLYRSACPTPMELGEYQLDKLPQQERMAIASHVRDCPYCRVDVRQLESYLRDLALAAETPDPSLTSPVRVLVARLLSGGAPGKAQQPAYTSSWGEVRGAETGSRVYQVDGVLITIEIHEDPSNPARKMLLGLIIDAEPGEMEAHLWKQDHLIGSAAVEESGNFILAGIEPGGYELSIRGKNLIVNIEELDVF